MNNGRFPLNTGRCLMNNGRSHAEERICSLPAASIWLRQLGRSSPRVVERASPSTGASFPGRAEHVVPRRPLGSMGDSPLFRSRTTNVAQRRAGRSGRPSPWSPTHVAHAPCASSGVISRASALITSFKHASPSLLCNIVGVSFTLQITWMTSLSRASCSWGYVTSPAVADLSSVRPDVSVVSRSRRGNGAASLLRPRAAPSARVSSSASLAYQMGLPGPRVPLPCHHPFIGGRVLSVPVIFGRRFSFGLVACRSQS